MKTFNYYVCRRQIRAYWSQEAFCLRMTFASENSDFGFYEAECQGCDIFTRVDDVGLCDECAAKLDRDLIRQRDWDRSITAYMVPLEQREELRKKVIRKYGKNLELIAPQEVEKLNSKARKRGKRRRR